MYLCLHIDVPISVHMYLHLCILLHFHIYKPKTRSHLVRQTDRQRQRTTATIFVTHFFGQQKAIATKTATAAQHFNVARIVGQNATLALKNGSSMRRF